MVTVKRYTVSWRDLDGSHESKPMSLAEANETAKRLRMHQAEQVRVDPVRRPPPRGYDENWRLI